MTPLIWPTALGFKGFRVQPLSLAQQVGYISCGGCSDSSRNALHLLYEYNTGGRSISDWQISVYD